LYIYICIVVGVVFSRTNQAEKPRPSLRTVFSFFLVFVCFPFVHFPCRVCVCVCVCTRVSFSPTSYRTYFPVYDLINNFHRNVRGKTDERQKSFRYIQTRITIYIYIIQGGPSSGIFWKRDQINANKLFSRNMALLGRERSSIIRDIQFPSNGYID